MSEDHPIVVGRYLLHRKIARGGMATIHIARLVGDVGFSRIVAAKRMHPELAEDPELVTMFLDEARIASKVHHRNVINVLDVVTLGTEVMLVQEYVHGAPLSELTRAAREARAHVPVPVAAAIACQILAGLHAAHETVDELGTPLHVVHRDVSPQNIIVAIDGAARLLDFGVAKAALRSHVSRKGTFKGKLAYAAPEHVRGEATKQSDIYSLGVVLWELLVGQRLYESAQTEAEVVGKIMAGKPPTITDALAAERAFIGDYRWGQLEAIEPVVRKALDASERRRWVTAADMEEAIATAVPIASTADVAAWLRALGKDFLDEREALIAEEEVSWRRRPVALALEPAAAAPERVSPSAAPGAEPEHVVLVSARRAEDARVSPMAAEAVPPRHSSARRRGRSAWIAALVVALGAAILLLVRDLGHEPETSATAPRVEPGTSDDVAPVEPAPIARSDEAADTGTHDAASAAGEAATAPVPNKPTVAASPARKRTGPAARLPPRKPAAAPSRGAGSAAPAQPAASPPALDCSTPFYFEGHKKIFKPGCL